MTELQAKQIMALLAWASYYNRIPDQVNSNQDDGVACSGTASNSSIHFKCGELEAAVNRSDKLSSPDEENGQEYNLAELSHGTRIKCKLDESGKIIGGEITTGSPSGEMKADVKAYKARVSLHGSSTDFKIDW